MGIGSSEPLSNKKEIPPEILELSNRGICSNCILRILGLSRTELSSYNLIEQPGNRCPACFGILQRVPEIKESARVAIGSYSFYDIQIEVPNKISNCDKDIIDEFHCAQSCLIKNYLKAILSMGLKRVRDGPILKINIDESSVNCELQWPNMYITGRYLKESRRVSHSRFMPGVNPVSSVEGELISKLSGIIKCSDIKFQSAGREDMDVRMIGSGRPFCLVLLNPVPTKPNIITKNDFLSSYIDDIPKSIECNYGVSAKDIELTLDEPNMEPKHSKQYQCIVSCSRSVTDEMLEKLNNTKDILIQQRTPCRVSHRREMMDREKKIISLSASRICSNFFLLKLKTSTGTYIKEFVNSDFGRTQPSLGSILDQSNPVQCQILQLDVICVGEP